MSRRLAREFAIQFLYSTDFNRNENTDEMLEDFYEIKKEQGKDGQQDSMKEADMKFAEEIIKGTIGKLQEIDQFIQNNTTGWTKERIAKVDLAILRLALYEILFRDDIPDSVSINEAIELAKKYSTDESGSFVNGVLGKIIREADIKVYGTNE
ncbi:MAG TPA: transcription antitermination factor NusB [Bacillota bacterium]|nr:transcription antitermination factor NusB [Bacillota bacterium]HNT02674.1 transcription antitermination factor NusB [Bacillota bacterium]HNU80233.1 transcription antitermination factor NusB [Bacillota bacterium]HPA54203.1 transcription antitermination factor NusB [Bacillota bacterium]HPL98534.1 transcription antitermination factor NusB [Bacillota bacterium]